MKQLTKEQQKQVEELMPMAKGLARDLCGKDEDALGIAYLALCKAVKAYKPGTQAVGSFAHSYISLALLQHIAPKPECIPLDEVKENSLMATNEVNLLDFLPDKFHELFRLKYIEGLEEPELCSRLNMKQIALRMLIKELEDYVEDLS